MWQIDGRKDCVLTWGDLIAGHKDNPYSDIWLSYEKSAETIVPREWEGLNIKWQEH